MSFSTNIVFSDRPLLSMYRSLLDHLVENVFPMKNIKWSIEGYWPGFQQDFQFTDNLERNKIAHSVYYIILRPQLFEIDERVNFTWRLESPKTFGFVRHMYKPIIETDNYSCYLKYIRIKGSFEIELIGNSLPYIMDVHLNILTRFSNKFTFIKMKPYTQLIPMIIENNDPDFWNEMINSNQVNYAYVGLTGQQHYIFERTLNSPLLKLTSTSSAYDNTTYLYTYTLTFEYLLQYPVYWLLFNKANTSVIYTHISYEDILMEQILATTDQHEEKEGDSTIIKKFIPYGNVKLYDVVSTLTVFAPNEPVVFRALYFKGDQSYSVPVNVATKKISNSMFQLTVTIEDDNYLNDPSLINLKPVILEYGVNHVEEKI